MNPVVEYLAEVSAVAAAAVAQYHYYRLAVALVSVGRAEAC